MPTGAVGFTSLYTDRGGIAEFFGLWSVVVLSRYASFQVMFVALGALASISGEARSSRDVVFWLFSAPEDHWIGEVLSEQLGRNPWGLSLRSAGDAGLEDVFGGCGKNLACMAKQARLQGAEEILLLRAISRPGEMSEARVQFMFIDTKIATVVRKFQWRWHSPDDMRSALQKQFVEVFDQPLPPPAAPPPSPEPTLAAAPVASEAKPEADSALESLSLLTANASEAADSSPTTADTARGPSPSIAAPGVEAKRWWQHPNLWTYTGAGVGAAGAVVAAVGFYLGVESQSPEGIEYGAGGTTQLEAQRLQQEASSQAGTANLLMGIGLGALAVGAGLVVMDLYDLDEVLLSAGASDEGVAASLTWSF